MGSDKMASDTASVPECTPPAYQNLDPMTTTPETVHTQQPTKTEGMAAQAITHSKAVHIQHKMDRKRQKIRTKMDAKQQKMTQKMTKLQREVDDDGCCNWTCNFGGLSFRRV